jgi:condensin-2 complex subunit G2
VFRAWRDAGPEHQAALEQQCIQPLMQAAILAATPALYVSLRRVLSALHEQKSTRGVDALLHKLYEPILWRHLKAAHPTVRAQALGIALDAFPIQVCTGDSRYSKGVPGM